MCDSDIMLDLSLIRIFDHGPWPVRFGPWKMLPCNAAVMFCRSPMIRTMSTISLLHLSCGLRGGGATDSNFEQIFQAAPYPRVYRSTYNSPNAHSWFSYIYELSLNADGSAQFFSQQVLDRDTDDTYTYFGIWTFQNGVVDFNANSRNGKQNYESEQVSIPCLSEEKSENVLV